MATISQQQQQSSSPPSVPSPQALASRGRRPALIPHNADLSLSLSAAATALGMASYSPNRARGSSGNSGSLLWVLPSSSPPTAAWSGDSLETCTRWKEDGQMCDIDLDDDQREAVRSLVVNDVFSWVNEMDSDQPRSQLQKTKIPETAPTSPMSGNFPEELDFRRRRLQETERDMGSKR